MKHAYKFTKRIYLIRHGQSIDAAEGKNQVESSPLSEHGKKQAEVLAKRFQHIPIDLIISSPITRAKQTAEIVNRHINKEMIIDENFVERKFPSETESKDIMDPEVINIFREMHEHMSDPDWHYSDEENLLDVKKRGKKVFEYLQSINKDNILVVTHGFFISVILSFVLFADDFTLETLSKFRDNTIRSNTGISEIAFDKKWKLLHMNDDAHLGEL